MLIYGIDRKFKLTVGAYKKIAELLPGGNIESLGEALTSDDPFAIMTMIFNLAVIMNERHEKQMAFIDREYRKNPPLTVEELETLSLDQVTGELKDEVMRAIIESQTETLPLKKTEEAETDI